MDASLNDADYLHKVKLEHHLDCPNCVQKLKEALQSVPGIVSVTIPEEPDEPITAIVVGDDIDVYDLDSILKEKTNLNVVVQVEQANCHDESQTVKDFNHEEFDNFCNSFNSEVAKSVAGTMGGLYKATYGGVVRVCATDYKIQSRGTAFVVCKKEKISILLTTAHTFSDFSRSSQTYVVSSDFKHFKAKVWHVSKEMDLCLLIVKGDLGPKVWELETHCDDVNFGEDIFSISCAACQTSVEDSFSRSNFKEDLLNTLWFSLSKGYVSHPFLVGVHQRNLDGIFLQLHGGNWGEGSSGAPIMNMQGRVIGMYLASSYYFDASNVNHWGLRLNSIRDYLEKLFKVSEERKGKNLKSLLWSCCKEMRKRRTNSPLRVSLQNPKLLFSLCNTACTNMEFWGVEVKSGEPLKVMPGDDDMVVHLSQSCLGEVKKGKRNESVCLFVTVDEKTLVLGTLSTEKLPQLKFDLVFEKDFELTHNWKRGSVYFYGYRANNASGKQKVQIVEPNKYVKEDDESSDEDIMFEDSDDDDLEDEDDSDDSEESDEETPKKIEPSKKRAAESATMTPAADKKAKATQKTDGKKVSGHVATPHPAKQAGKTPASKPNQRTPKSGGSHTCKSCNKGFGSDKALESHSKAKHGGN